LEEAGLHRVELSLLLEPGVVKRQQRGLDDLGRDVSQLRLHQLLGGDGDSELPALARIGDGLFETRARGAQDAEGNAEAGIVETGERRLQPLRLREPRAFADLDLVEVERAGEADAHAELVGNVAGGRTSAVALDDEAGNAVGAASPDDGQMGDLRVGDPELAPGDGPALLRAHRARVHRAGIAAVLRLGEAEAANHLSGGHLRQPLLLLRLGPVAPDGVHREAGLHGDEGAQAGVARLQLVASEPVRRAPHARAPIALEVGAEQSELRQLRDELGAEAARLVILDDARHAPVLDEPAHAASHNLFVYVEERVPGDQLLDVHRVHASPRCASAPLRELAQSIYRTRARASGLFARATPGRADIMQQ